MTPHWATDLIERRGTGPNDVTALGYLTLSMIKVCRFAADNDNLAERTPEERASAITATLEVAEHLLGLVIDGAEHMEHKISRA